jgi:hypothetical protein
MEVILYKFVKENSMKKLTDENRIEANRQIEMARAALADYKERNLSTFTDEGRKIIQVYWDAQTWFTDTLSMSMTRANNLIEGKATISDYWKQDGTVIKASDSNTNWRIA